MRVCHVTSGLDARSGGPAVAVTGLVAAQRQAGLDVSVVATYSGERPTSVMDALAAAGIRAQLVGPTSGPLSRHSCGLPLQCWHGAPVQTTGSMSKIPDPPRPGVRVLAQIDGTQIG